MRAAIALLIVALLILAAAWNAGTLLDAWLAVLSNDTARHAYAVTLALFGAALGILALVMISRRAYRQIEIDFPDAETGGIGAADRETVKRSNERV